MSELRRKPFSPNGVNRVISVRPRWVGDQAAMAAGYMVPLPEDWVEEAPNGTLRVKASQRSLVPARADLNPDGSSGGELTLHFVPRPFRFCLWCGVAYAGSQWADIGKLATLGSGGCSTATTIAAAVRWLRSRTKRHDMQKLLAFTDNRQDASLQAGHFNDFVQTSLVRSALQRAVTAAGQEGIGHDELTRKVFDALELPLHSVRLLVWQLTDSRTLGPVHGWRPI